MLLFFLLLLLAGCGSAPVQTPGAPPESRPTLTGPFPLAIVRVSYADEPSPYTDDQLLVLRSLLNTFLARQSTGRAYPFVADLQVQLPHPAATYRLTCPNGTCTQVILDQGKDLFPVQTDCLAAAPYQGYARLFLLPSGGPTIYVGYGSVSRALEGNLADSYGWVSGLSFAPTDLFSLPVPHELGHMLGLPHGEPGVMSGTNAQAQKDWEGMYAPILRSWLGWI